MKYEEKVEEYISKQKSPKKEILQKVRKIIFKTLPKTKEEAKWGVIAFGGGKFYLAAMKERVHLGFSIKGLSKKEIELFEGSGKTMRHIKIDSLKEIDEKNIVKLLKLVDKKAVCSDC